MSQKKLPWIIAYDIRCPSRLQRLYRFMKRVAAPVQYSVFLGYWTTDELDHLMETIDQRFLADPDDLRAYPVAPEDSMTLLGTPRCPANWTGLSDLIAGAPRGDILARSPRVANTDTQAPEQKDFFDS